MSRELGERKNEKMPTRFEKETINRSFKLDKGRKIAEAAEPHPPSSTRRGKGDTAYQHTKKNYTSLKI